MLLLLPLLLLLLLLGAASPTPAPTPTFTPGGGALRGFSAGPELRTGLKLDHEAHLYFHMNNARSHLISWREKLPESPQGVEECSASIVE